MQEADVDVLVKAGWVLANKAMLELNPRLAKLWTEPGTKKLFPQSVALMKARATIE